jgi:Fe-Mn family superoxide dismutase
MKKAVVMLLSFLLLLALESCNKKKYTEVVEVPLPNKDNSVRIGSPDDVKANKGTFSLYKLPYKFSDFDPTIDAMTMEFHYSRYYLNYTNTLNKLVEEQDKADIEIEDILKKLNLNDTNLRNNAGGFYNHNLYFQIIKPESGGKPKDTLEATINRDFGSFENFKRQFTEKANNQFGSGWAWLVVDKSGKLQVSSTLNNDNPLMPKQEIVGIPILCIDVWEHAYYLGYQNQRKKYIDNFFKIINWRKVEEQFVAAIKK